MALHILCASIKQPVN